MTRVWTPPLTPERGGMRMDRRMLHPKSRRRSAYRPGRTGCLPSTSSSLTGHERNTISDSSRRWRVITFRNTILVCLTGIAWACLIVHFLGPPSLTAMSTHRHMELLTSSSTSSSTFTLPRHPALYDHEVGRSEKHSQVPEAIKYAGRKAFPDQFNEWDDARPDVPVVVNKMDLRPLTTGNETLPTADLVLAILSGVTEAAHERRDLLRELYDRYNGWITVAGRKSTDYLEMSFRVIFVVSDLDAPKEGRLIGDILYVPAPDGYRNIVHKVKHMMSLVRHLDFKYLLKADDDTFVCVRRLAMFLHAQPDAIKDKIYAGVPTACNLPSNPNKHIGRVIQNDQDKWYDQKFVGHTLAGLDCFPVYMQGAFYVLAKPLVEHIYRGREHYDTFVNEDVTVGSWLLGVDRALAGIHTIISAHLWECTCARDRPIRERTRRRQVFFHNCKMGSDVHKCAINLYRDDMDC